MRPKKTLLFIFSICLLLVFIIFSYFVEQKMFTGLDFATTAKFQSSISRKFDLPFSLITLLGSVEVTGVIWLIILVIAFIKKRFFAFLALGLFWLGLSIEVFGKAFLFHPAPPIYFYRGEGIIFPSSYIHTNFSYPSGHIYRTSFILTFIVAQFVLRRRKKHQFLILASILISFIIMFISRIYLGEHWLTDVIGGLLLGASLGIIPALVFDKKMRSAK